MLGCVFERTRVFSVQILQKSRTLVPLCKVGVEMLKEKIKQFELWNYESWKGMVGITTFVYGPDIRQQNTLNVLR